MSAGTVRFRRAPYPDGRAHLRRDWRRSTRVFVPRVRHDRPEARCAHSVAFRAHNRACHPRRARWHGASSQPLDLEVEEQGSSLITAEFRCASLLRSKVSAKLMAHELRSCYFQERGRVIRGELQILRIM